jgi:SAM-dependent methyltransferase
MNPAELAHIAELEDSFWWYTGMRQILFALLDPVLVPMRDARRACKLLEIGCGTGYMTRQFEQRYKLTSFPTDLARQALEYITQAGTERAAQSDATLLPYAAESFDIAVALDVLVHLRPGDEKRAVQELARVLKSGGLLVLRVAALDMLRSRHSQFILEYQRFTRKRLLGLMVANGFQVIRCTYANTILMPIALAKFRIWESLLRRPPASGVTQIGSGANRLLGRALLAEKNWLAAGRNLPIGQSLIAIARKA